MTCTASPCRATESDGMIRMFTVMTVLIVFGYIWNLAGTQCTSLSEQKKMIVNFVILTMLSFLVITVWFAGVIPNEAYDTTLNKPLVSGDSSVGKFADCDGENTGYQVNGVPFVTRGRAHYLEENFKSSGDMAKATDPGDVEVEGEYLSEEWRHIYHLGASAGIAGIISGIMSFTKGGQA